MGQIGNSDAKQAEGSAYAVGKQFVYALRAQVEGGHGREDDAAHFGDAAHVVEVGEVERGFARHQHEAAALFESNVGGSGEQVVAQAVGNGGEAAHGAGGHQHAGGFKRAAGNGGAEVADGVHHVGQRGNIFDAVCGFVAAGVFRAFGNHEMGFDIGCVLQQLQGFVAVLEAVGAADAEDEALGGHGFCWWLDFGFQVALEMGYLKVIGEGGISCLWRVSLGKCFSFAEVLAFR